MLEITIDDNTDMNQVKEMVRKYYLEHNIVSGIKPKKTKTKPLPIGNNNTDSLDKEYIEIDGYTYCHLDCIGFKGYYICKEDAGVYREVKGELNPIKASSWMPRRQSKSPALIVSLFNGEKYTTRQLKTLYAICFVPNPFGYNYVVPIDGDYTHISIDNLRWTNKKPRG